MYLQTSRLQYNLQGLGVFQTIHSSKKFKQKPVISLYHPIAKMQLQFMPVTHERQFRPSE